MSKGTIYRSNITNIIDTVAFFDKYFSKLLFEISFDFKYKMKLYPKTKRMVNK